MFTWMTQLFCPKPAAATGSVVSITPGIDLGEETLQLATVWEVVDRFLTANPQPTVHGIHALIEAGAANLLEPDELIQACEKIQQHGYQHPINPTLIRELSQSELLEFLRWQRNSRIEKEYYANQATIRELIERFRLAQ